MRELIEFPKIARGFGSKVRKLGVAKRTRREREERELLVIGTGRCGTTYLSSVLRKAGLDCPHEKVGKHGTVSHYFAVDSDWYPAAPWQDKQQKKHVGERRSDFIFNNVWHVVRDPLKVIPSLTKIFGGVDWEFYEDNGVIERGIKSPMERAMQFYLRQNFICEGQADVVFRIEDIAERWGELSERLGLANTALPETKVRNASSGFRKVPYATWGQLNKVSPFLATKIRNMAEGYGYEYQ